MLNRIKWEEDTVKDNDGLDVPNSCHLVWEGVTSHRAFGDMKFKVTFANMTYSILYLMK